MLTKDNWITIATAICVIAFTWFNAWFWERRREKREHRRPLEALLQDVRGHMADRVNVPPWRIIGDRDLKIIEKRKPQNKEQLEQLHVEMGTGLFRTHPAKFIAAVLYYENKISKREYQRILDQSISDEAEVPESGW